jgi:hypothetical protein
MLLHSWRSGDSSGRPQSPHLSRSRISDLASSHGRRRRRRSVAGAVRAGRGDGAGAAVLRAGGRGAQDGERARHAPHRLRRLPPGDRRRHAPPRLARRQGVHAAAHGRRRAGLRAHLRGLPSHVSMCPRPLFWNT